MKKNTKIKYSIYRILNPIVHTSSKFVVPFCSEGDKSFAKNYIQFLAEYYKDEGTHILLPCPLEKDKKEFMETTLENLINTKYRVKVSNFLIIYFGRKYIVYTFSIKGQRFHGGTLLK